MVKTLGGVVTEYTAMEYTCSLNDLNGEKRNFKAYGMNCITGDVSPMDVHKIRTLFPHVSYKEAKKLTRLNKVQILLGMPHPSWHPERAERAKGGDFGYIEEYLGLVLEVVIR